MRYDGIRVDHGLEISSQLMAARTQVRGYRKSICRKLQALNSVVIEMAAVHTCFTQWEKSHAPSPVNDKLHYNSNPLFRLFRQGNVIQLQCLCRMALLHTSPIEGIKCIATILVTIESSAGNSSLPTWIPATVAIPQDYGLPSGHHFSIHP